MSNQQKEEIATPASTAIEMLQDILLKTDKFVQSDSQSIQGIEVCAINHVNFNADSRDKYTMMHLFKQTRLVAYEAYVLAKSLHDDCKHYVSPSLLYTRRELRELVINTAYIYRDVDRNNPKYAAQKYFRLLLNDNTKINHSSDRWSGKTRADKFAEGIEHYGDVSDHFKNSENFDVLHKPIHSGVLPCVNIVANPHNILDGQMMMVSLTEAITWLFLASKYYYKFVNRPAELTGLEQYKTYVDSIWQGDLLSILNI